MSAATLDRDAVRASLKLASKTAVLAYFTQTGLLPADAAGLRSTAVRRSSGTLVSVYDAAEAGLEADGGWATVCEPHSRLVIHETLTLAEYHASDPLGWCGVCNGSEDLEP